jgi:hypothetical protein
MAEKFEIVNCEDCVFFTDQIAWHEDVSIGHCRRYPPVGKFKTTTSPNFGSTFSNHWCGEGRVGDK